MASISLIQSIPLLAWFKLVNDTVPEPYLDEVFHVRQAQHYCKGHFTVWDPKITTPPGLYLYSYLFSPLLGCDIVWLRGVCLFCLTTLLSVISWTYAIRQTKSKNDTVARHSALNVTLFPPLFFFSALYYTDVPSTVSVLVFHWFFLFSYRKAMSSWLRGPLLVLLGIISLMFRQTNIFWVAVFPAGIALVHELDSSHQVVKDSMYRRTEGFGDSIMNVAKTSWKLDVLFDPPVWDAYIEEYMKTIISMFACGVKRVTQPKHIFDLLGVLMPYLTLIGMFAAFVIWNGSVVLGDKSNHIATLHLPQMLYIWPLFTFFSWPIIYPYLALWPFTLFARVPSIAPLETMLVFRRRRLLPRIWITAIISAILCVVVRFNTIVHPFTLADNRHYTFYVFRLLMRPWWIKYAVTPVYVICGWSCIQALGARPGLDTPQVKDPVAGSTMQTPSTPDGKAKSLSLLDGRTSATTSFVLLWLATTTLQLVTAPLVEPRYFILPWIFWRMHVPFEQAEHGRGQASTTRKAHIAARDNRLWLETLWLLLINAATGYIFLYWEFTWPQDPGRVQRFLW